MHPWNERQTQLDQRRVVSGGYRTNPQQARKAAGSRDLQCVRSQGTAARLPGELKEASKNEEIMARMRRRITYCKAPASLLGFSRSKFMSLSLGSGQILVLEENKTRIQKPDLMGEMKLTTHTPKKEK